MNLALPKQKTVVEQICSWPAVIAAVLFSAGAVLIPVKYPVEVMNGSITPSVAAPSQTVAVKWTQDWRERCPITVTREFIGADGFKKTAEPFLYGPPEKLGIAPYDGPMTIPLLPIGKAYYHSILRPHCWIDHVWQREYSTPFVPVTVVAATPPGPR